MKPYLWLTLAFITSGLVRIVVKLGSNYNPFLFIFVSYSTGSFLAWLMSQKFKEKSSKSLMKNSILLGVLIGIINFFAFYSQLLALSVGEASIIFPITSLSVYLAVILSVLFYKEALTIRKVLGIFSSILAIVLLSW